MLGQIDPTKKKCIVIGAGINGLFTAYFLKKQGFDVTVYESSMRTGGLINTEMTSYGMCQHGPHLTRSTPAFVQMCSDLNVELENAQSNKRFFYKNHKRKTYPVSMVELIKAYAKAKFRLPKEEYLHAKDFFDYHTTPKVSQNILNAIGLGIYGVDLHQLDPEIAFPKFFPTEAISLLHHYKKTIAREPKSRVVTPVHGFLDLVNALSHFLQENIFLNTPIDDLTTLDLEDNNLILTTPSYITSELVTNLDENLSRDLAQVSYSDLQVSTISFKANVPKRIPRGIGILSSQKQSPVLGSLFSSTTFHNRSMYDDSEVFSVMSVVGTDKETIEQILRQMIGQSITINHHVLNTYKRGIPIYNRALKKVLQTNYSWFSTKGRMIFGNYTATASVSQGCQEISDYLVQF